MGDHEHLRQGMGIMNIEDKYCRIETLQTKTEELHWTMRHRKEVEKGEEKTFHIQQIETQAFMHPKTCMVIILAGKISYSPSDTTTQHKGYQVQR